MKKILDIEVGIKFGRKFKQTNQANSYFVPSREVLRYFESRNYETYRRNKFHDEALVFGTIVLPRI